MNSLIVQLNMDCCNRFFEPSPLNIEKGGRKMNYENLVLGTLSNDAFVMVNKKMARKLGFNEAGLLGELIATYNMVKQGVNGYTFYKDGVDGAWFYLTQPTVEERLGIKRREHDTAIKNLVKENVIEKEQKGLPAKSYYLLNWKILAELMSENEPQSPSLSDCTKRTTKDVQNVQPSVDETYNQDVTKRTTIKKNNKNKEIKTNNNNNTNNSSLSQSIVNSIEEILTMYAFTSKEREEIINLIEFKKLSVTKADIIAQCKAMKNKNDIRMRATYFVNGLEANIGREYLKPQTKKEENTPSVPFYNWLEENEQ